MVSVSRPTPMRLAVAILTFQRPEKLRAGLPLVLHQVERISLESAIPVVGRVMVIDNDPTASARRVTEALDSPLVSYLVEPTPGISAGRNRALDEARDDDLLVFIDDDEQPRPAWLSALVATWADTRAAAVVGRVAFTVEGTVDPWVSAGGFFRRSRYPTGTDMSSTAAGNLLLDLGQIRALGVRFDPQLGLSGGEDTLFGRQLARLGGRIVWCDESIADDVVDAERATRRWVLDRSRRTGNTTVIVELRLAQGSVRRSAKRVRAFIGGCGRTGFGAGRLVVGLMSGSHRHQAYGMHMLRRGQGMVAAAVGVTIYGYPRAECAEVRGV